MLNPRNIKQKHIHFTTAMVISYFILFPSQHPKIKQYIYNVRLLILVYMVLLFDVDPLISLFLMMLYLVLVYKINYDNIQYKYTEPFTSINTEAKKELLYTDNYEYDASKYVKDSEYKHYNEAELKMSKKYISDEQLEKISSNQIEQSDSVKTFKDTYNIQGTSYTLGANYGDYGDLS
jgi:hypothetical protein